MPNFSVTFRAMGCQIRAWLTANDAEQAAVLQEVPIWFEAWEAALSRFRATSELCYLNSRPGKWTRVSPVLLQVLSAGLRAAQLTGGLVNPLILPALEAAGYVNSFDVMGFVPAHPKPRARIQSWTAIEIDTRNSNVRLPRGARIDLGGIGKGWAAEQTANRLAATGPCLVDAGGDIVARGTPDGSAGWLVTIPVAQEAGTTTTVTLKDSAVATSGTDYRQWSRGGQRQHHLIDPRTGRPADTDILTATVLAPDAIEAEAWAKSAIIGRKLPKLPAFLVREDGSTVSNSQFDSLRKNIPC